MFRLIVGLLLATNWFLQLTSAQCQLTITTSTSADSANRTDACDCVIKGLESKLDKLQQQVDKLVSALGTNCFPGTNGSPLLIQQHYGGNTFFNKSWTEFKLGFGNQSSDFWIGNNRLHELTKASNYKLHFDLLAKSNGVWYYAEYNTFIVDDESTGYRLHFANYSGTAGDALGGVGYSELNVNNMMFTTYDRDNDQYDNNCSLYNNLGGFWFNACGGAFVNGADITYNGFGWYGLPDGTNLHNLLISRTTLIAKG